MMVAMTYEVAQRRNIGWMSEAHRLSLGANRPQKRPAVADNTSRLSQIALARRPHAKIARDSIMRPAVARWLWILKIGSGVQHSTM